MQPHDLLSLRIPRFQETKKQQIDAVVQAARTLAASPHDLKRLAVLDEAVFDLYDLDPEERVVAADSVDRARYLIFENRKVRVGLVAPPSVEILKDYARQVARTVNAYLRARGERHLEAVVYDKRLTHTDLSASIPGVTAVRFIMSAGGPGAEPIVREGEPADLEALATMMRGQFESDVPPYLNERRQLRLYGEDDVFILKPTEGRYWTRTAGLNDADVILADHWLRRRDAVAHA